MVNPKSSLPQQRKKQNRKRLFFSRAAALRWLLEWKCSLTIDQIGISDLCRSLGVSRSELEDLIEYLLESRRAELFINPGYVDLSLPQEELEAQ